MNQLQVPAALPILYLLTQNRPLLASSLGKILSVVMALNSLL